MGWLSQARATDLPRIISLNLCADPYLMAFADPAQIIALSNLATDPELSAFHEDAGGYPQTSGRIEDVLALKPDIVIASPYSDPKRLQLFTRNGIRLIYLDAAQSYEVARADIIKLGHEIGRPLEARGYLETLDQRVTSLAKLVGRPRILVLQRRGLTIGGAHVLADIIKRAGGDVVTASSPVAHLSLENAISKRADFILVGEEIDKPDSRGAEFLSHPAINAAYPKAKRLHLNNALTLCAGATTPLAIKALQDQLQSSQNYLNPAK